MTETFLLGVVMGAVLMAGWCHFRTFRGVGRQTAQPGLWGRLRWAGLMLLLTPVLALAVILTALVLLCGAIYASTERPSTFD